MLRTRAMRERDEMKMFIKHYRFALLRVRMPDGLILQGEVYHLHYFSAFVPHVYPNKNEN